MKIAIAMPLYVSDDLHREFAEKTIRSIVSSKHELSLYLTTTHWRGDIDDEWLKTLFDNIEGYTTLDFPAHIEHLGENMLSKAWNTGIRKALEDGNQYVIVPNADIIFHNKCIDNLVEFAESHGEFVLWSAADHPDMRTLNTAIPGDTFDEHPHFSCYMVSQKLIDEVGYFDENFIPAYFEDNDMHHRILVSGNRAAKTASALFYHFGSRTIKVDEELNRRNAFTYEKNRQYFKNKWGYDPHGLALSNEERISVGYKHPFNDESKGIKDW